MLAKLKAAVAPADTRSTNPDELFRPAYSQTQYDAFAQKKKGYLGPDQHTAASCWSRKRMARRVFGPLAAVTLSLVSIMPKRAT